MTKNIIIAVIFVLASTGVEAFAQRSISLDELRKSGKSGDVSEKKMNAEDKSDGRESDQVLMMAEGGYSKVNRPFVFVARDESTYSMLDKMVGGVEFSEVDFDKYAVVAAFSGEKETGGYSISIKLVNGICEIKDVAPPHGAIVTDALTKPYSLAIVPIEEQKSLNISTDETWESVTNRYEIKSGEFQFEGGFIGITKRFEVGGEVKVIQFENFVTMYFSVVGTGNEQIRAMQESGSGSLDGKLPGISRLEGGSLIDRPHPPLQAMVMISEAALSIDFVPGKRDYVVNDGFTGKGKIKAEKILSP